MRMEAGEPIARSVTEAIRGGDAEGLAGLLAEHPEVARGRVFDEKGVGRTLLLIATDWPGHFPNVGRVIATLIARGADPDEVVIGGNAPETPLHAAASSNDVAAIDALLDGGANIEAPGAIFTNGAPMSDAVIFAQWGAARRLLERGAKTTLTESAALGLMDRVRAFFEEGAAPERQGITAALWHACRAGQLQTAAYVAEKGADLNWIGWDNMAPLDGALQSGNEELIGWLRARGARTATPAAFRRR